MSPVPHGSARRRRRLLLWTSPLVFTGVLTGVKLLSMAAAAEVAQTAVVLGDPEDAVRATRALFLANVVEPYKAPFAAGTAVAAAADSVEDLRTAEAHLRAALALADGTQACAVHYNLALVLEAQGDATSDPASAATLFDTARQVASQAPADCARVPPLTSGAQDAPTPQEPDAAGSGADAGETEDAAGSGPAGATAADDLEGVATRTSTKSGTAQAEADQQRTEEAPPPGSGEGTPVPVDERRAALEQRLLDAAHDQREADGDGAGGAQAGEQVPAPW